MSWLSQLVTQTKYNLLIFRRNPAATFFTVILPLIFLVLFTSFFGNSVVDEFEGGRVRASTFYVPGILALAIVSATLVNLAITTTSRREEGVLKRVRGTPLRPWVFIVAQVLAGLAITAVMTVLVILLGRLLFDVSFQFSALPGFLISLILGTVVFSALGLALSTIIPSIEAAPAFTNAAVLPLYFVSDVFILSNDETPRFLTLIGDFFPIKHLVEALTEAFNPFIDGVPMPWTNWLVMTLWGAFGLFIAITRFRWTPR